MLENCPQNSRKNCISVILNVVKNPDECNTNKFFVSILSLWMTSVTHNGFLSRKLIRNDETHKILRRHYIPPQNGKIFSLFLKMWNHLVMRDKQRISNYRFMKSARTFDNQ